MAAKRKTRSGRKSVAGDKPTGSEPTISEPTASEPTGSVDGGSTVDRSAASDVEKSTGGRPVAPTTGPVPRGGAGFSGVGRGQGAGSARRYAFRRS